MNGSNAASAPGESSTRAGVAGGTIPSDPRARQTDRSKFANALAAFLILPCLIAIILPALVACCDTRFHGGWRWGYILLGIGIVPLFGTAMDLFTSGRGTLAPWDPPKCLVAAGYYGFVRNPMYLAVLVLIAGWGVTAGSNLIIWYWLTFAITFHVRVLLHEEPWLRRNFPAEWAAYSASVPRWLPRLSPWRQAGTAR